MLEGSLNIFFPSVNTSWTPFPAESQLLKNRKDKYANHPCTALVLPWLAQNIAELVQRAPGELVLGPQVGGQEAIGVADSHEGGLEGVLEGFGRAGGLRVRVLNTGKLEETLDGGRGNEASATGGRNKLHCISTCRLTRTK